MHFSFVHSSSVLQGAPSPRSSTIPDPADPPLPSPPDPPAPPFPNMEPDTPVRSTGPSHEADNSVSTQPIEVHATRTRSVFASLEKFIASSFLAEFRIAVLQELRIVNSATFAVAEYRFPTGTLRRFVFELRSATRQATSSRTTFDIPTRKIRRPCVFSSCGGFLQAHAPQQFRTERTNSGFP